MSRTDRASRIVPAPPWRTYQAPVEPAEPLGWPPPAGTRGEFGRFDLRPGGGYRLVLTYADAAAARGRRTGVSSGSAPSTGPIAPA